MKRWLFLLVLSAWPVEAIAQATDTSAEPIISDAPAEMSEAESEAAYQTYAAELLADVQPERGNVPLEGAPVTLNVSDAYDFYDAAESRTILEELWGNPPDDTVLGMIFPAGLSPAESAWGAIYTYEDTGYVSDDDAASTDYSQLLADMQAGILAANPDLKAQGYAEVTLAGWAVPPVYDHDNQRLIWAKDLIFSTAEGEHTLNYDMRLLGRGGVLSVNFVAPMDALPEVKAAGPEVIALASFNPGTTYADYVEGDKTAGYGVAALIAGGAGAAVLKKAGLLAVAFAFLKKGFVLIPLALMGLWRVVRGWFGGGAKS